MLSLLDIATWIINNRRATAFNNYTLETILDELDRCSNDLSMLCIVDKDEKIVGVFTGKKKMESKTMFIYNVLTTKPGVVKQMLQWVSVNYPGYAIKANRRLTRPVEFNVNKLISKI